METIYSKIGPGLVISAAFVLTVVTTSLCATPVAVLLTRSYQPKAILVADGPLVDAEEFGRSVKRDSTPIKQDSADETCEADPKTGLTSCQDTIPKTWCDNKASALSPGFKGDNFNALAACNHAFGDSQNVAK